MRGYADGRQKAANVLGMRPETLEHLAEIVGLGALSAYPAYHLYNATKNDEPKGEHLMELGGLGILAAPTIIKMLKGQV